MEKGQQGEFQTLSHMILKYVEPMFLVLDKDTVTACRMPDLHSV